MTNWRKLALLRLNDRYLPEINATVKTALIQNFLIVFNFSAQPDQKIIAFDLKGRKWLTTEFKGEDLVIRSTFSVCAYNDQTVIVFGADTEKKEDQMSILTFHKGSEGKGII